MTANLLFTECHKNFYFHSYYREDNYFELYENEKAVRWQSKWQIDCYMISFEFLLLDLFRDSLLSHCYKYIEFTQLFVILPHQGFFNAKHPSSTITIFASKIDHTLKLCAEKLL